MINFEELYILWYSRVKAFALEYVRHEADAENIVQDVFADLYEKRNLIQEDKNVTAYVYTSIKNKCLQFLKEKQKTRYFIDDLSKKERLACELNVSILSEIKLDFESETELEQALNQAIDHLPPQCRKIFTLNKFEHVKRKDIARQLNLSINTIETQMALAYKKIKKELKLQHFITFALLFWLS